MSRPLKVAGFQVTLSGRFWPTALPPFDRHFHSRPLLWTGAGSGTLVQRLGKCNLGEQTGVRYTCRTSFVRADVDLFLQFDYRGRPGSRVPRGAT